MIADDHAVVRAALRDLFLDHPELEVVGEAADGAQALALTRVLQPDVVVMDVAMPRMDGIEATRRICAELPAVEVLGLSTQEPVDGCRHPIEAAGAVDCFTKDRDIQRLVDRLLAAHAAGTA